MSMDTEFGTPGWAVDCPSSDYNSTSWNYDSAGHPEGTPEYSGVPDHGQSIPVCYTDPADQQQFAACYAADHPRAIVGERSVDTIASAEPDVAVHESHGVLGALFNIFEFVVNIVWSAPATSAPAPTTQPGTGIDPATGKPLDLTYGGPGGGHKGSHW